MGMAASSLRFAQLTARKNQVEFEGQQINQQRLTLSQKSSAIYNDMLTKQVPTAPDPSAFTKIVYKFNSGRGTSSILNLARKTSGAYNYNVTYKRPKTTTTLSRSSFTNVGFAKTIGVTGGKASEANYYARTANINGVARTLTLVGSPEKMADNLEKKEILKTMRDIEAQINSLQNKKGVLNTQDQQNIKSALGLDLTTVGGQEPARTAVEKKLFGEGDEIGLRSSEFLPTANDLSGTDRDASNAEKQAAYDIANLLGVGTKTTTGFATEFTKATLYNVFNDIMESNAQDNLKAMFGAKDSEGWKLDEKFGKKDDTTNKLSAVDVQALFSGFNKLQMADLQNYLVGKAEGTDYSPATAQNYENYENYTNYGQAADSLYEMASGRAADSTVTSDQMINVLQKLLSEVSGGNYTSSSAYEQAEVTPASAAYSSSASTPGIVNVGPNEALYQYEDDNGNPCFMFVNLDNITDDGSSTYADSVSVYENALNYLDGEYETEQQDANVIMSDDGQVSKITFADGTVVTPEVVTEMDSDAYDQAMVEYEYKKQVYDKEMNDANAKVKIIQAQDQKLEVRLKQLDTEQKALSTEIDAVKSVRDKSIEGSFKTFG